MQNCKRKILVGNSFPLPLIRRAAEIAPQPAEAFPRDARIVSYWGHANTLAAANAFLGVDLTPETERPALSLSPELLPSLNGESFDECWVLSPDYAEGFRPAVGSEVSPDKIKGWTMLRIVWH